MLLPQFSIRWLLGLTAVIAALAMIASFAYQGQPWAVASIGAVAGLAVSFLAFGFVWAASMAVAWFVRAFRRRPVVAESPFAMHKPAPQVIEPQEFES